VIALIIFKTQLYFDSFNSTSQTIFQLKTVFITVTELTILIFDLQSCNRVYFFVDRSKNSAHAA